MIKALIKKWIFLFMIIIFNFIIALRTSIGFFYFFFWFLVSGITISFLWIALQYFSIKLFLQRKVIGRIEEDDILDIETRLENKGVLPIFNFILEDCLSCAIPAQRLKRTLLEYLGLNASLNLRYSCPCPKRGRYDLGPFVIYFFDPCGLFFFKKTYYLYSEVYVYPKVFKIKKFPELLKGVFPWFGISTTRRSGDDDEFYGVREYKTGDPIKRIHWFSSARKNKLIIKEFQCQSFSRATILFNLEKDKNYGEGKECVLEYMIKIAASIAKYLIERNVSLEVIAHAGEIVHFPFNKGNEHLEDIFRFLSVAKAESRIGLNEIFQEFSRYIPSDSNLIVIMLDKDWQNLAELLSLEKRNVSLIALILISSTFLYSFKKDEVIRDIKIKLSKAFNFTPLTFARQDNFEEIFS